MSITIKEIEKYIETEVAPKSSIIVNKIDILMTSPELIDRINPPKNMIKEIHLPKYHSLIKHKDNYYKPICSFLTIEF